MNREEYIKFKIKEKGFTIKEYARTIGMPYSSLLSMLSGNLGGASLDNVVRICTGLGFNLSVLQKKDGILDDLSSYDLSLGEMDVIRAYRALPRMQEAVKKILA
ncbi:MAG: hypothetical protein LBD02_08250 [Christensenellaceae bacterium]|nr:hypothetical protein [Christensenellaceae bacterium]